MEDEQWLQRLLESSRMALKRRRESPEPDERLTADLEALCIRLEQRLCELRGGLEN